MEEENKTENMPVENQETVMPTPSEKPMQQHQGNKKDYLAPALVFIALFFSFFVLVTMQRLSRKAVDNGSSTQMMPVTTMDGSDTMKGETSPAAQMDTEKTIMEDNNKDSDKVGDEMMNEIDSTTANDVNNSFNPDDLNDLNQ